jgi:hypothetical protein
LTFCVEDTVDINTVHHWVSKSRDSGGNLVLSDQPQSGWTVTTTHDLNRQKVKEFIQENQQTSQRAIVENLNCGLASGNEIIVRLGYKMCVLGG